MKLKRICKYLCIFFICIGLMNVVYGATVEPTLDFYINDYAEILTPKTEDYIINVNKELNKQSGAQIVIVTLKSLEGRTIEDYATELFNNFEIGNFERNNGVLFLLALDEREFRIEVGTGLEELLTDEKTGEIQDEFIIPYFKENKWNFGIKNGFNKIARILENHYAIELCEYNEASVEEDVEMENIGQNNSAEDEGFFNWWLILFGLWIRNTNR